MSYRTYTILNQDETTKTVTFEITNSSLKGKTVTVILDEWPVDGNLDPKLREVEVLQNIDVSRRPRCLKASQEAPQL